MRTHTIEVCLAAGLAALFVDCGPSTRQVMSASPAIPAASTTGTADRTVNVAQNAPISEGHITHEVRHELVMLPYYGVFDNIAFQVNGGTVTLQGQVTRPSLKTDAENVVKNVEGVLQVINNIQVLSPSPDDDRIRLALYHAIYGDTTLSRYALQAVPPIHIIVQNGRASLEGVVATEADKNMAEMRAKEVPGVLSVTNNLRAEAS